MQKLVTALHGDIAYTHGSDETAICGSRKDLLFQSHVPAEDIQMNLKLCAVTQLLYAAVSEDFSTLVLMIMPLLS